MNHPASVVVPVLLIAFILYRRIRRTIGYQKLAQGRMTFRMVALAAVGALMLVAGAARPVVYLYDLVGIAAGIVLAYYAIRTTTFERRGDSWYYRPNAWVGAVLLVLFIGRLGYRLYEDYILFKSGSAMYAQGQQPQFTAYYHDPSTTLILFALIAYYVVYYSFVIRNAKHL
jgi:membrane protein CcdC involved in cytochrome C biogenesis